MRVQSPIACEIKTRYSICCIYKCIAKYLFDYMSKGCFNQNYLFLFFLDLFYHFTTSILWDLEELDRLSHLLRPLLLKLLHTMLSFVPDHLQVFVFPLDLRNFPLHSFQ
eukprot:UN00172